MDRQTQFEQTEKMILCFIAPGYTKEDLFWMRVDLGREYLRKNYSESDRKRLQASKAFWAYWRQQWHSNDRKLIDRFKKTQSNGVPFKNYQTLQQGLSSKRVVNTTILKMAKV